MALTETSPQPREEQELRRRLRRGDSTALSQLLERYWERLVRFADGMVGSMDQAEDVVQDAFVRVWEKRTEWTGDGTLESLLYRVVRNAALDSLRRSQTKTKHQDTIRLVTDRHVETPSEAMEASELSEAFDEAVAALPPKRREVFVLIRHSGLSYAEAAEVLGVSPQTVANHMHLAMDDLRQSLEPHL